MPREIGSVLHVYDDDQAKVDDVFLLQWREKGGIMRKWGYSVLPSMLLVVQTRNLILRAGSLGTKAYSWKRPP